MGGLAASNWKYNAFFRRYDGVLFTIIALEVTSTATEILG